RALREIYRGGKAADPVELGDAPRGRILALDPMAHVFMLTRRLVGLLASGWLPWDGKEFDHAGNSGINLVQGKRLFPFRTEVVPSQIDGEPTLSLSYQDEAFKNPWPLTAFRDELRTVASGISIGPMLVAWRGQQIPLLWFGLERTQSD